MANLYYYRECENKCRLYYIENYALKDGKIQSDIYLDIDIVNKEVQKVHDFFHKLLINKVLNGNYSKLEIDDNAVKKDTFYQEESFERLRAFLDGIIVEMNEKLENIAKQFIQQEEIK